MAFLAEMMRNSGNNYDTMVNNKSSAASMMNMMGMMHVPLNVAKTRKFIAALGKPGDIAVDKAARISLKCANRLLMPKN